MGMDIGYFGPIKFLKHMPPQKVKDFFEELLTDPHFTIVVDNDFAIMFAFVDDLLYTADDAEIEQWIADNIKPIADPDGYCRLFITR